MAGENDNAKNLITGTRYLNVEGMLPFENRVAAYLQSRDNHVLYRVTPIFENDNLVASRVEMEAWSVEDQGQGICFHVYCYNVQPNIVINYLNGDSSVEEGAKPLNSIASNSQNGNTGAEGNAGAPAVAEAAAVADISANDTISEPAVAEDSATVPSVQTSEAPAAPEVSGANYIVNTNTGKIHLPGCSSVSQMAEHNKWYSYDSLEYLESLGYVPCKRCLGGQ